VTKVLIVAAGEVVACGLRDVLVEGGCVMDADAPDVVVSDETSAAAVAAWVASGLRVIVVSPDHTRMTVHAGTDGTHEGPLTEALLVAAATSH
jgi:hypothetical protein